MSPTTVGFLPRPVGRTHAAAAPAPRRLPRPVPWPSWQASAVLAAAWAVCLFPVALWVAGGGITDLLGGTSALTSMGRLAGMLAGALMLLQVTMMARIPAVEQALGQDRLVALHRFAGFTGFTLMCAHIALSTWGYAADSGTGIAAQAWDLVANSPGMLLATAGTTLVLPHQLWTGNDLQSSTAVWWALWILAAGSVIVFRLALPAWRSWSLGLTVAWVRQPTADTVEVGMRGPGVPRLRVAGGQFFQWRFLAGPGWTRAIPVLNQQASASGQVDTVSGATYTSAGYAKSLQSALDQAGLV